MPAQRFDIFCKVIDNYGDAGVSWRLARQLVREHGIAVSLWIDALDALARLAPRVDVDRADQVVDGVRARAMSASLDAFELPDVVVEAFGCGLPDRYLEAMVDAPRPPVWINLEYLSAEPWVEGTHGLPSPQPRLPLTRHFFFPGFTAATGGLLREAGLLERRRAAQANSDDARATAWQALGIAGPAPGSLRVSIFCYPNRALASLLDLWADGSEPVACYVPEGVATAALDAWSGGATPLPGQSRIRGALALTTLPFVDQDAYDRLLWRCDVNFVRGEDSFVRAQWAARPFVWHIYPQAGEAHRAKLEAFLHRYTAGLDAGAALASARFWRAWNDGEADTSAWTPFRSAFPMLAVHGRRWADQLAELPDLAASLVQFARDRL
jgi:uncharacterized repeat protein (TIGR03837 family)